MNSPDGPSFVWCVWILVFYIFNHVQLRMMRLTGHIRGMNTAGIAHFATLTRWYLANYWRIAKSKVGL